MRRAIVAVAAAVLMVVALPGAQAAGVERVSGNTVDVSAGENGSTGWWFNRDAVTDYTFTFDEARIGFGSLYVGPITTPNSNKFKAENFLFAPIDATTAISFDFLLGGTTVTNAHKHFYLNVYANRDGSTTNFYDCRYDYIASAGSATEWTTVSTTAAPNAVTKRGTWTGTCPATLAGMATAFPGSTIRAFTINVGDTGANDIGVDGYLDNVVVSGGGDTTVYDFEPGLTNKDECKNGGHVLYGFDNQGACISSLQANERAGK